MRSNSSVGDRVETSIDLRDDNRQDNLLYDNGEGTEIISLSNFQGISTGSSNKDILQIDTDFVSEAQYGNSTAAAILTHALGQTVAASQVSSDSAENAVFRYNGDSFYLGASDGDWVFENGEMVVRFIGGYDINQDDIVLL